MNKTYTNNIETSLFSEGSGIGRAGRERDRQTEKE